MRLMYSRKLLLVAAVILLFWSSLYLYVPVLPVYAASLEGSSLGIAGLIVSMYGLSQLILRVPLGIASDRLEKRIIFVWIGLGLSLAAAVGMGLSEKAAGVAIFRGVSGAAAATWVVLSVLFTAYFPPEAAVKAMGFVVFLSSLAQMAGTLGGGVVTEYFGYQAPFFLAAIVAVAGMALLLFVRGEPEIQKKQSTVPEYGFKMEWLLLFVSFAAAIGQYVTYATTYGYAPILADQLGASRMELGWLTTSMLLTYMFASIGVSVLITGRSEKIVALVGLLIIGIASFSLAGSRTTSAVIFTRLLHGIGHGLSYPVLMGLAIKKVPHQHRATAMGVFQAIYALGMFTGPAVSGWIVERWGLSTVFFSSGWLAIASIPFLTVGFWVLKPHYVGLKKIPVVK